MMLDTATLFNATLASSSLAAAFELGFMERLESESTVDLRVFCTDEALNLPTMQEMSRALACFDIVSIDETGFIVKPGPGFVQAYRDKGYFLWLVCGYGYALQHLARLTRNAARPADSSNRAFVQRDGRYIAMADKDCGAHHVDSVFERFFVPRPGDIVCDLGCGAAGRLISLVTQHEGLRAVGVDIDQGAAEIARANVEAAGLADKIQVVVDDVRSLSEREQFEDVTVLTCFFMGHELWPKDRCVEVFARLRRRFPSVERFFLGDTFNSELVPPCQPPIFTLGFEFLHAVMGQRIPTLTEWMSAFAASDWECARQQAIPIPFTTVFDLRPRSARAV